MNGLSIVRDVREDFSYLDVLESLKFDLFQFSHDTIQHIT